MKDLINIIEKLKIGSKSKITNELESIEDFSEKYNSKIIRKHETKHNIDITILQSNELSKITNKMFDKLRLNKLINSQNFKDYKNQVNTLYGYYIECCLQRNSHFLGSSKVYIYINDKKDDKSIARLDIYMNNIEHIFFWFDVNEHIKECEKILINLFDYMVNNI